METSFSLPLRPVSERYDHKDTLPIEISQINSQWGSFRDVSEAGLRAEIAAGKDRQGEDEANKDNASEDVDTTERLEQLYKRRADITQFAM